MTYDCKRGEGEGMSYKFVWATEIYNVLKMFVFCVFSPVLPNFYNQDMERGCLIFVIENAMCVKKQQSTGV